MLPWFGTTQFLSFVSIRDLVVSDYNKEFPFGSAVYPEMLPVYYKFVSSVRFSVLKTNLIIHHG